MNRNYHREMENILSKPETHGKKLLLHSCCAPCSSYCLEYLRRHLAVTVFYYNPNIAPAEEYRRRKAEQQRLIGRLNEAAGARADRGAFAVDFIEGDYEPERFAAVSRGREDDPEGGERCFKCYELRLAACAGRAKISGADYFTTTLSISPLKNAAKINEIGERIGAAAGISFLPADFKKNDGYKRSAELSKEYGLYRQDFCGCEYSKIRRQV